MSMERVKEIEEHLEQAKRYEVLGHGWANNVQFLIDEYKQQNEQIEEWENTNTMLLKESHKVVKQKDQRIEELEQANARGNGHVKACEERIEYLEKALNEIELSNSPNKREIARQALNK